MPSLTPDWDFIILCWCAGMTITEVLSHPFCISSREKIVTIYHDYDSFLEQQPTFQNDKF